MGINATELEPVDLGDTSGESQAEPQSQFPHLSRQLSRRAAYDPRAMALRERAQADNEIISDRHFQLESQKHELAKVHTLTGIMSEEMRVQDSMEKQRQTMHFLKGLREIPVDDPDFEYKVADLGVAHPMALDNDFVGKAIAFRRKTAELRQTAANQQTEQRNILQRLDAERRLKDEAGQTFVPPEAPAGMEAESVSVHGGTADTRFVKTKPQPGAPGTQRRSDPVKAFDNELKALSLNRDAFENPETWQTTPDGKKKFRDQPDAKGNNQRITIGGNTFDRLQKAYSEITGSASTAQTEAAGTSFNPDTLPSEPDVDPNPAPPAGMPSVPDDHAEFLRNHPEKAASFDARYGAGASARILGK